MLVRFPLKWQSYQSSIQCWATIGPPAKRHFNGASLASRWWLVNSGIRITPPLVKLKKKRQSWTPSDKIFWIRAWSTTQPAYILGSPSAHQQNAIQMECRWPNIDPRTCQLCRKQCFVYKWTRMLGIKILYFMYMFKLWMSNLRLLVPPDTSSWTLKIWASTQETLSSGFA